MKNVKILGTGCANCRNTLALVEEVAQIIDRQVQQPTGPPGRHVAGLDRQADHFDERLGKRRRRDSRPLAASIVAQGRVGDRPRRGRRAQAARRYQVVQVLQRFGEALDRPDWLAHAWPGS